MRSSRGRMGCIAHLRWMSLAIDFVGPRPLGLLVCLFGAILLRRILLRLFRCARRCALVRGGLGGTLHAGLLSRARAAASAATAAAPGAAPTSARDVLGAASTILAAVAGGPSLRGATERQQGDGAANDHVTYAGQRSLHCTHWCKTLGRRLRQGIGQPGDSGEPFFADFERVHGEEPKKARRLPGSRDARLRYAARRFSICASVGADASSASHGGRARLSRRRSGSDRLSARITCVPRTPG
jgi:hypothetical protein